MRRDVYRVPAHMAPKGHANKPLILKVPRYAEYSRNRPFMKRLVRAVAPYIDVRIYRKEARYRRKLSRIESKTNIKLPIPAFYGFVETTVGQGSLWEAACDGEGNLAPTLAQIDDAGLLADVIDPLNECVDLLYAHHIVAPDVHKGNLVLATDQGRHRVMLIDGFADHRIFSTRSLSARKNAAGLQKRFLSITRTTGLSYDVARRRFFLPGPENGRQSSI